MPAATLQVVVVGAGAAGLGAALELKDRGVPALLLEQAARAGGKVATSRESGFLIEHAAVGLLDREGDLGPLCARLGVALLPANPSASTRFLVRDGTVYALPASPLALATTGLFSAREKWKMLGEPFRKRAGPGADRGQRDGQREASSAEGESISAFFARRLGPGGAFLGEAIQTGIYAGDATRLEAESCFPSLVQGEREHGSVLRALIAGARKSRRRARETGRVRERPRLASFLEGVGSLMDALAAALGPLLRTSCAVHALRREQGGFRLSVEQEGVAAELSCSQLILALPAPQAAQLLEPLDAELAAQLGALRAAPVTQVHLGVRERDLARPARGFGLLAPGRAVLGTLFPSALWPGRAPDGHALLTSLVGGAHHPEAAALPEDELVRLVRDELATTVGLSRDAAPTLLRVRRWAEAIPQYNLGHKARVAAIDLRAASHPGLRLAGSWLHGVSVLDCLRDGRRAATAAASALDST